MKSIKEIYREGFAIPGQNGRLTDRVFLTRIASSVIVILVLMAAMGLSAYAYFTSDLQTSANSITSASYDLDITVTYKDGNTDVELPLTDNGVLLDKGVEYTVKAVYDPQKSTATTGFVCVNVGNGKVIYNTCQVGRDAIAENGQRNELVFTVKLDDSWLDSQVYVTFTPNWGTSVYYTQYAQNQENHELYIIENEEITVTVN